MVLAPLPQGSACGARLALVLQRQGGPHGRNGRGGTNLQRYVNVLVDKKGGPWT